MSPFSVLVRILISLVFLMVVVLMAESVWLGWPKPYWVFTWADMTLGSAVVACLVLLAFICLGMVWVTWTVPDPGPDDNRGWF